MSHSPLISIILPVYNVEKYIDACLDSICNQDYKNLEIILVDDGSKDRCPEICDSWGKRDYRIHVIHKTNGGVSSARNVGLKYASGEYITFVDPDDYISQGLYSSIVRYMPEYDMIYFGFCACNEKGNALGREEYTILEPVKTHQQMIEKNYPKMLGFSVNDIRRWNKGDSIYTNRATGMVWQFAVKRIIISENHIHFKEELIYQEDDIFSMECLMHSSSLQVVPVSYYSYVQRSSNITHTLSAQAELAKKYYLLQFKNQIRDEILEEDHVDVLEHYAGSNVLSVLQVAVLCVQTKAGYQKLKEYINFGLVKESITIVPLEMSNIKFNAALLLLKCHAYYLLYLVVQLCDLLHINIASGFS